MSPSKIFLTFFSAWSSGNKSSEVMISLSSLIRIFFSFSCFYLFRFRGRVSKSAGLVMTCHSEARVQVLHDRQLDLFSIVPRSNPLLRL